MATGCGPGGRGGWPSRYARLVQVSTDYVRRHGLRPVPRGGGPEPTSAYGRTKLAGEEAVITTLPPDRSLSLRTAWLYGAGGANFVKTMLTLQTRHDTLNVVDDQRGQPTWSRDLANQIEVLVVRCPPAAYHGTAGGHHLVMASPARSSGWPGSTRIECSPPPPRRFRDRRLARLQRARPRSVAGSGLSPMRPWNVALAERCRRSWTHWTDRRFAQPRARPAAACRHPRRPRLSSLAAVVAQGPGHRHHEGHCAAQPHLARLRPSPSSHQRGKPPSGSRRGRRRPPRRSGQGSAGRSLTSRPNMPR